MPPELTGQRGCWEAFLGYREVGTEGPGAREPPAHQPAMGPAPQEQEDKHMGSAS